LEGIIINAQMTSGWKGQDLCFSLIRLGMLSRHEAVKLTISVTIIATLIVGWSMQVRADLAVPIVFSFFVGAGTSFLATSKSQITYCC
jgi:hypothetical protein